MVPYHTVEPLSLQQTLPYTYHTNHTLFCLIQTVMAVKKDRQEGLGRSSHVTMILAVVVGYILGRNDASISKSLASSVDKSTVPETDGTGLVNTKTLLGKSVWDVLPMEHTPRLSNTCRV